MSTKTRTSKKLKGAELCSALGGDYDYDNETCDIKMDSPKLPRSVATDGLLFYFMLQVLIGSAITVVSTFYSVTLIPTAWWASYIILAIVFVLAMAIQWYKLENWTESFLRTVIATVTIAGFSVVIGWIYYWNVFLYWDFIAFAQEPIACTIIGLIISSLLSIVLIPPEEREFSENDLTYGVVK